MHLPLSEPVARRILEAYRTDESAMPPRSHLDDECTSGLGAVNLKSRPLGAQPYAYMCNIGMAGTSHLLPHVVEGHQDSIRSPYGILHDGRDSLDLGTGGR